MPSSMPLKKTHMKYCASLILILLLSIPLSAQNTILWKVAHPDSEKVSYLLGTYHQLGNSFVDSIPIITESLLQSDQIIFESIDSKQALIDQMNERPCTDEIKDLLNKNELATLNAVSEKWKVKYCKLTPRELNLKLDQELPKYICNTVQPTDTWQHFDNYLISIAKANDKALVGLETTDFQLKTFNDADLGNKKHDQKRIKKMLKQLSDDKPIPELCAQVNDYRNFKIDYHIDGPCPESILLKGRNENWMKKLPELLAQNNCFVAVGLAHLMMECGIIASLRKEGYIIEPIVISKSSS